MHELLIYIRALLIADAYLLALCESAGATEVEVIAEGERTNARYPRIILSGDDGSQHATMDNIAKLFDGRVRIEIVCRESDACPDPLGTLTAIKARIQDVLLGNRAHGLPGVFGQKVGPSYNCTRFRQANPSGRLPSVDPAFERHRTTYETTVNRRDW